MVVGSAAERGYVVLSARGLVMRYAWLRRRILACESVALVYGHVSLQLASPANKSEVRSRDLPAKEHVEGRNQSKQAKWRDADKWWRRDSCVSSNEVRNSNSKKFGSELINASGLATFLKHLARFETFDHIHSMTIFSSHISN